MNVLNHRMDARCPPQSLWRHLSDIEAVAKYNPLIKAARARGTRSTGIGAERECDLEPTGKVVERVITWEEGRAVGLELIESDWPVRTMRWVTRIEPLGSGSVLSQRLEYEAKFGPLGWLLDAVVLRRNIRRNVERALRGLVLIAESDR